MVCTVHPGHSYTNIDYTVNVDIRVYMHSVLSIYTQHSHLHIRQVTAFFSEQDLAIVTDTNCTMTDL